MTIGVGCMRLSTASDRDDERSVAVIHAALDAGATLIDTSDAYCWNDKETGHNERLIADALATWGGDRTRITVASKGGLTRPKGAWVADGRAKHLREACEASRRALGVETIDLYQLHAIDPKTPIETSVRALAKLRDDGWIREIGLCNVTVSDIRAALAIAPIATVQVSLSPLDDENLRNGVVEFCRDNAIRVIAYRSLGGERIKRLLKDDVLSSIARKHGVTVPAVALAWLMSFGEDVIPIPGPTKIATASSIAVAAALELDSDDRRELDAKFSGRLLRVPRAQRRVAENATADVVIVMGMPGAGKTTLIRELAGYRRLNRDDLGGSLSDIVTPLRALLSSGERRVVLDNTYPTRKSRNEIIEAAWECGVPVRCVWLHTDLGRAQINAIHRMIDVYGSLPSPEVIRERGKSDPRFLLPDAQFRYERTLEPPTFDEGFTSIEERAFSPAAESAVNRAIIVDFDDLLERVSTPDVQNHAFDDWLLFIHVWRPQIARGEMRIEDVTAEVDAFRQQTGLEFDWSLCSHDAGPPICWCRKPIPGAVIEFARRRDVALTKSLVVGTSAADRTMAARTGAKFTEVGTFFRAM